ncbi:MAG: hypothetical protein GY759_18240 [Chloroflexi bacterium]|nr:hypothetical protein [Chloroflexota bacterium]
MSEQQQTESKKEQPLASQKEIHVGEMDRTFPPLTAEDLGMAPSESDHEELKEVVAAAAAAAAPSDQQTEPLADIPVERSVPEITADGGDAETALDAESVDSPPAPAPPPADPPGEESGVRSNGRWRSLALIVASAVLGALLVLAILILVNGTLDIRSHDSLVFLRSQAETLSNEIKEQGAMFAGNVAQIKQVDEELDAAATETAGLSDDIQAAETEIQALAEQILLLGNELRAIYEEAASISEAPNTADGDGDTSNTNGEERDVQYAMLAQDVQRIDAELILLQAELEELNVSIDSLDQFTDSFDELSKFFDTLNGDGQAESLIISEILTQTLPLIMESLRAARPVTANDVPTDTRPSGDSDTSTQTATSIVTSPTLELFPPLASIFPPEPGQSHIFGLVWDDQNADAQATEGEPPIPIVFITLKTADGAHLATAITSADGRYFLPNLDPGTYFIEETDPEGASSITPNIVTITTTPGGIVEINFADSY